MCVPSRVFLDSLSLSDVFFLFLLYQDDVGVIRRVFIVFCCQDDVSVIRRDFIDNRRRCYTT